MLRFAFLVAVVALAAYGVISNWDQIRDAFHRLSLWAVLAALVAAGIGAWSGAPAWRSLLAGLGSPLLWRDAQRVFLTGQLGKYIPGGVWSVLAQVSLAKDLQVPRSRSGTASLLAILLAVVTSLALGSVLLAVTGSDVLGRYWWTVLLVLPFLALLHPSLLAAVGRLAGRITGRTIELERIPERNLLSAAAWLAVGQLIAGTQIFFLGASVGTQAPSLALSVGLFAFAAAAGILVIIAPAGVGIREIVLVLGLTTVMDSGSAVLVVLMARLVSTAADFLLAAWATAVSRHATRREHGPRSTTVD